MNGAKPDKVFNSLVQGTAVLSFSRLPIVLDNDFSTTSLQCNIKKYGHPDIVAEMQIEHGPFGSTTIVPNAFQNDFSASDLSVEFILDEDMENYNLLYRWLDVYKRLTYRTEFNTPDGKHWDAKQAYCPYLDIAVFDNNKKIKNLLRYSKVFITNVGGFTQDFASSDPITFTCVFKFVEFHIFNKPDNIREVIGDYV